MDNTPTSSRGVTIKNIYLYLVSFVALMMMVFSTADVLNITLRTWVFPKADNTYYYSPAVCAPGEVPTTTDKMGGYKEPCATPEQDKRNKDMNSANKQRDLVRDLSMILVAVPVFAFHWRIVRRKEEV